MSLDRLDRRDPWVVLAVLVWALVLGVVCVLAGLRPRSHSLYPTFAAAGHDWVAGALLYGREWKPDQDVYRYSPLAAVLLVPFSCLPEWLGGVVWRLVNAGLFLGAFAWWQRAAAPAALTARQRAVLFLVAVPLALSSLRNGQPNLAVTGLLLAALAGSSGGRWVLAAGCVALATALKVYPLALGLLLAAAYPRRFGPWLLAALVVAAGLPFLCQEPGYVAGQYVEWYRLLSDGDLPRRSWPLHMAYRDLWLLFRILHVPITTRAYLVVQLLAGAGCALVCVAGRLRGWPGRPLLLAVLALGTCWMTLCGPATESSTYVLLAPALAWAVLSAGQGRWPGAPGYLGWAGTGMLLAGVLAGLGPWAPRIHALGPHPFGALFLSAGYLAVFLRALLRRSQKSAVRGQKSGVSGQRAA